MAWERRPPKQRDPRTTRRYRTTRAAWLPHHHGEPCALHCGHPVDTTITTGPWKATVEHTLKVHDMRKLCDTWDQLVELCCDTDLWAIAHQDCQAKQGAALGGRLATASTTPTRRPRRPSRDW